MNWVAMGRKITKSSAIGIARAAVAKIGTDAAVWVLIQRERSRKSSRYGGRWLSSQDASGSPVSSPSRTPAQRRAHPPL